MANATGTRSLLICRSKPLFERTASGSTTKSISFSFVEGIRTNLWFPLDKNKIADLLSIIDYPLPVQTQKIKALRVHEKGLMQQIFPRTEKVGT